VVRVRPDGTGLELYSFGTRSILEVAVSPLLTVSRDNTNDLAAAASTISPAAKTSYPRLFKNFADEIIAPLAD
jgi:hypothetical protein